MRLDRIIAVRNDKTIYRDGGYCMKVFVSGHRKSEIFAEALSQARAEETGLPVPRLHEVTMLDGKWAIVSELIRGQSLEEISKESRAKKYGCIAEFVSLQLEVQSKECGLFPRFSEKVFREISALKLDRRIKDGLFERLERLRGLSGGENVLCHGDFAMSNVIDSAKGLYILDWSHASRGFAAADAARSYLLFWMAGDIDGAGRYLSLYAEKSGVPRELILEWTPLAAASQMKRCKAVEREFLLDWLKR